MPLARHPLVIAHRGASAEQPENTLAAFRQAIACRVDGIELDVHVTRDGVPVVFHDATLARLTGAKGRLSTHAWAQLGGLRVLGSSESIPRLVDVLRLTRSRAVVQVELKAGAPVAPVVRAIRAAGAAEWVVLASFSAALVRNAGRLAPAIPRMLISDGRASPRALACRLAACGAGGISVAHQAIRDARWVRYFHARGYAVWTWTVNDRAAARRLAGWGVDALLGDNPALLRPAG